ncbi:MAG: pyrroline-5-carboxylate reductase [Clostridia bacterium]|nr:pyrroline-5-carboxylate reductase [Clostridia bacterium]
MKKKFRLGVIGAGFMSTAIIKGVLKSALCDCKDICVSDSMQLALDKISQLGVHTSLSNLELVNNCEYVLFAVKPQNLNDVLLSINGCKCEKFISIMAGVKKQRIKNVISGAKVARSMPNTPCSLGVGAIGLDLSDYDCAEDKDFICSLFSALGQVVLVSEDKLNAVTGVSGSAPAYFYLFVKSIIDSGVKHGLSYEQAKLLAVNTMLGSSKMILENKEKSIDELINAVCSKGGTTIEAVNSFNADGLDFIVNKAINACVSRSTELENL